MHRLAASDVRLGQPQRSADHRAETQQQHQADEEFVAPFHAYIPATARRSRSVGRPSMKFRTTGSSVCTDLLDGTDLTNAALVEHRDAVSDGVGAAHVVSDDDAGDPQLLPGTHHELVDHRGGDRIETGGRLVVQNVARPKRDRPRDPHPLPHATGQLGRQPRLPAPARSTSARLSLNAGEDLRFAHARGGRGPAGCCPRRSASRTAPRTGRRSPHAPAAPRARPGPARGRPARPPRPCPTSGSSSPTMCLRATLFPVPENPMITVVSPSGMSSERPSRTCLGPNDLWTSEKRIMDRASRTGWKCGKTRPGWARPPSWTGPCRVFRPPTVLPSFRPSGSAS